MQVLTKLECNLCNALQTNAMHEECIELKVMQVMQHCGLQLMLLVQHCVQAMQHYGLQLVQHY